MISAFWILYPPQVLKRTKHPAHGLYLWVLLTRTLGKILVCFHSSFVWNLSEDARAISCPSLAPCHLIFFSSYFVLSLLSKPFFFSFPFLQTTKAFLPRMLELQKGHIVCLNSVLALSAIPGAIDYCTSKASSFAFMESLTLGLLDCPGVNATTVLPFHTSTEMFQGMRIRSVQGNLNKASHFKWIIRIHS